MGKYKYNALVDSSGVLSNLCNGWKKKIITILSKNVFNIYIR